MKDQSRQARARAVSALLRIEIGGAYISRIRRGGEANVERRVTDLVAGVTRWRRYLDFLAGAYYRGILQDLEPRLKQILRIAIYEWQIAGRPAHAVFDGAVQLAADTVRPGAGRLVNAILRNMQRAPLPTPHIGDASEDLATRHSHPTWMVRRWLNQQGTDATRALLEHNNRRPAYGIRCNTLRGIPAALQARLTALGAEWKASAYLHDFLVMTRLGPIVRAGLLDEGECAVQDQGAGLVVRLLDPRPGERMVDLCAAPGGKATYAAALMKNRGVILAVDRHEKRLRRVADAARTQGIAIIETKAADLRHLQAMPAARVLLDVPCTGTGVLAKRADLRWRRTPEDLRRIIRVQAQLLDAAAQWVQPGGILVYSTCSLEEEENEAQVQAFLARNQAFEPEHAARFISGEVVIKAGYLRTTPPVHQADGTFAARMRRVSIVG